MSDVLKGTVALGYLLIGRSGVCHPLECGIRSLLPRALKVERVSCWKLGHIHSQHTDVRVGP